MVLVPATPATAYVVSNTRGPSLDLRTAFLVYAADGSRLLPSERFDSAESARAALDQLVVEVAAASGHTPEEKRVLLGAVTIHQLTAPADVIEAALA